MNREQKRNVLVAAAGRVIFDLQHDGNAFFGNQGVSVYASGQTGDIIGYLLKMANILPPVAHDITDPKEAVAIALGLTVADLPVNLQIAINTLAVTADDTKRSYFRRVPKLVKLLTAFVKSLHEAKLVSTPVRVYRGNGFTVPGAKI